MDTLSMAYCEELKKILSETVKAMKSANPAAAAKSAARLRRFRELTERDGLTLEKVRALLLSQEEAYSATRVMGKQQLDASLADLACAVETRDRAKATALVDELRHSIQATVRAAQQVKKTLTKEKRTRLEWIGCGMFTGLLETTGFQNALADLAQRRSPGLAKIPPAQRFPTYTATSIIKPGPPLKGIQSPTPLPIDEEQDFVEKYGKVRDLPLRIVAPLGTGVVFDTTFADADFRGGKPADSSLPLVSSDADFTTALRAYAASCGEIRYSYEGARALVAALYDRVNSSLGDTPSVAALRKRFIDSVVLTLLHGTVSYESEGYFGQAAPDIADFRGRILDWGIFSPDGVKPKYVSASLRPPESLDNTLFEYRSLPESAKSYWLYRLQRAKNEVTAAKNEELAEFREQISLLTGGSSDTVRHQQIITLADDILGYLDYGTPLTDEPKEGSCFTVLTTDTEFFGIPIEHLVQVPELDLDYARRVLDNPGGYYMEQHDTLARILESVQTAMLASDEEYRGWYYSATWKYYRIYRSFFESIRARANAGLKGLAADTAQVERLTARQTAVSKRYAAVLRSYGELHAEIVNGYLYGALVQSAVGYLRKGCLKKKIVTDPYLPLVAMPPGYGAYGEAVRTDSVTLERLDARREQDFFQAAPGIGLLKEYRMEMNHAGFGLGAHLYSYSLFPGETVTLETRALHRMKSTQTESTSENIFEETGSETMADFTSELKRQIQAENKASQTSQKSLGGDLGGSFLGITFGATANGTWSRQDDERNFADQVESLVDKLSTRFSQKRQITLAVKTDRTVEEERESEEKTVRTYANDNREKNLTINFFQITRRHETNLWLDNVRAFYSSGRYPLVRVFVATDPDTIDTFRLDAEVGRRLKPLTDAVGMTVDEMLKKKIIEPLPLELCDLFAPDSFIVVLAPPYNVRLPLAQTNAFLAHTFTFEKAAEVSREIWRYIGQGQASPDGLGICAFPFGRDEAPQFWPADSDGTGQWGFQAKVDDSPVCADKVALVGEKMAKVLPNIDLRYKSSDKTSSRYEDSPNGEFSLPKLLWRKGYVVNTNGIYTENMLGRVSALEEFAVNHRNLDVRLKEIQAERDQAALQKDLLEVRRLESTLPPTRDMYAAEADFLAALRAYYRARSGENGRYITLETPPGADLSVNLTADGSSGNIVLQTVEKGEADGGGTTGGS
jgi:hypothetical protein